MKVWVTGGSGLLGSALQKELQIQGIPFAASTHSQADVTDLASLSLFYQERGPFTHLIHCAAYTAVDGAESHPEEARKANALSPAVIGYLAAQHHFRVVHLSTDYVFDGTSSHPYSETDRIAPRTVYGQTKAEGESHLLSAFPDACIVRTSWLFGEGGKNFVSTMMKLMQEKEEIRVVSDQRGRPTYAPDLAKVLIRLLDGSGIFHVANREETSWYEFAQEIMTLAQNRPLVCRRILPITTQAFGAPAPRPLYSVLDTKKVETQLGESLRSWRKGLCELLKKS
jgi:dTDP-4-dehydrorhamnose reductase